MSLLSITLLVALLVCAERTAAHAMPAYPAPFCSYPSRGHPCGCVNQFTTLEPRATWKAGQLNWITWFPINGDGLGPVLMNINTAGQMSFENNSSPDIVTVLINQPPGKPSYQINTYAYVNFTLPENIQCKGPANTCVVQMWTPSGNGWYGCTAVKIVPQNAVVAPNTNMNCFKYGGGVCGSKKYGSPVAMPYSHQPSMSSWWESNAKKLWLQVNDVSYFKNLTSSACQDVLLEYFCDLVYPSCSTNNGLTPTFNEGIQSECQTAMTACGATPLALQTLPCANTYAAVIYPKDIMPVNTPTLKPPTQGPTKTTGLTTGPTPKPVSGASKIMNFESFAVVALVVVGITMFMI